VPTEGLAGDVVWVVDDGVAIRFADVMTVEIPDVLVACVAIVLILGADGFLPEIVALGIAGGTTGVDV
jgi:hypothetical protein